MGLRDKLLIGGVGIFIIIAIIGGIYNNNVCEPKWEIINKKLDYMNKSGSVKKIELLNRKTGYQTNLISDTLIIEDTIVIEEIRKMINAKYFGTWNRPTASWTILMKVTFDNNDTFDFEIRKINNDKDANMTQIYFGYDDCHDTEPSCSLTLGTYLENLTGYSGQGYY
jgi:hypothetical protein